MTSSFTHGFSRVAGIFLLVVAGLAFGGASCEKQHTPDANPTPDTPPDQASETPKVEAKSPTDFGPPAPTLMMIAGLRGYTEPCGCTLDITLGGIDRIVKFVDDSEKLYPDFGLVDAGDLFFDRTEVSDHEEKQERARVQLVQTALKRLPIAATIPGERDFALGADFYLSNVKAAGLNPIGNVIVNGEKFPASKRLMLGKTEVLLIGVAEPALYKDIPGVEVSDPALTLKNALGKDKASHHTVVLLTHGRIAWVKSLMEEFKSVNFALIGHNPRETDQTDHAGGGHTLEPYDQGRYIGVLKIHAVKTGEFQSALGGIEDDLEKLERQIEHVNKGINKLPPASAGEEPPMLKTLRTRLDKLLTERVEIKRKGLDTPEDKNWFIWRSVPIEPEYVGDTQIGEARSTYNKSLKALNSSVDRAIVPIEAGKPFFIGTDQCAKCHSSEAKFWAETAHGSAYETLVTRDKDYDSTCVGCHVVGYEKPGGSVLGKVQYQAELNPGAAEVQAFQKDLRDVGCESCHGPGSMHRLAPTGPDGNAQNIQREVSQDVCTQCHVPEHSPRFNYDTYIPKITGKGHELRAK